MCTKIRTTDLIQIIMSSNKTCIEDSQDFYLTRFIVVIDTFCLNPEYLNYSCPDRLESQSTKSRT